MKFPFIICALLANNFCSCHSDPTSEIIKSFNNNEACINSSKVESCLLIIDVQNSFLPGGSLAISDGHEIIPIINKLREDVAFDLVALSQDWHCPNHVSFASQHPGYNIYDEIVLEYDLRGNLCTPASSVYEESCPFGSATRNYETSSNQLVDDLIIIGHRLNQTLWPEHCVQATEGAEFDSRLIVNQTTDIVVQKGVKCHVDSYSAFYDNGRFSQTELNMKLRSKNISKLFITGLALDYCVLYTALDAAGLGFEVFVVRDATRGVSPTSVESALQQMEASGIKVINSDQVESHVEC